MSETVLDRLITLLDAALQFDGNVWVQADRRHRRSVQDGIEDNGGGRALEGVAAGNHLVENRAKGKQIGAAV